MLAVITFVQLIVESLAGGFFIMVYFSSLPVESVLTSGSGSVDVISEASGVSLLHTVSLESY